MAARHVVVDGSNLATEGRSMPSLAQLDQAVREFLLENPDDVVTVVVDASFGHRIDSSEFKMFEEAEAAGELVSPPAGAIGRGDAFLLRIADKTGATVLSNDSFQEFHGDYDWLFERGRLIGGKPVPGVGWIFTPRTPVRGPRSREAVKEAKRKTKGEAESAMPGLDLAAERSRTKGKGKKNVERAIAVALEEVVAPKDKPRRRRKGGSPPADPVNDPLSFITFIAAHPLGAEVTATVDSFASHGAFVDCEGARCYVPLSAMGEPPPKSAREIFSKGEEVRFVVQALDPQRRGVELALPGFARIAGAPTEETVAAEIEAAESDSNAALGAQSAATGGTTAAPPARRSRKKAAPVVEVNGEADEGLAPVPAPVPVKKASSRRRSPAAVAVAEDVADSDRDAAGAGAGPAKPTSPVADAPAMKAAPRRRGRPAAEATPEVEAIPAAEPSATKKAAAKTPRKRSGATTGAVKASAAPNRLPDAPVLDAPAVPDEPVVTEAAPRRRGRSGQAAAPALEAASDATASPTPTKAAPRRRGSTQTEPPAAAIAVAPETEAATTGLTESTPEADEPLQKSASRGRGRGRGAPARAPGPSEPALPPEHASSDPIPAPAKMPARRRAASRTEGATPPDAALPPPMPTDAGGPAPAAKRPRSASRRAAPPPPAAPPPAPAPPSADTEAGYASPPAANESASATPTFEGWPQPATPPRAPRRRSRSQVAGPAPATEPEPEPTAPSSP